jgi:parallel beta-helix repeat protein
LIKLLVIGVALNKRNILVGIVVIFSVSLLGILIYGNGGNRGSNLLNNTSPSPSPNFKNSKTIAVPENYSTISLAINASNEGDTILVKEGTYVESVTVDKSLTIKGENKETTIVDGNNIGPAFLIKGNNVKVTGFKIRNVENPPPFSDSRARMAGIHLLDAHGCNISENVVVNTGKGVWIYGGSGNIVSDNTLSGNNYGILIQSSADNFVTGNQASNGWGGIWLESSGNNKLRNNKMLNNARNFGVSGGELSFLANDVDSSNMVNDKKVYYLIDKKSLTIDPVSFPDLGSLVLVNCTDVLVQNLEVKNNYGGIHIAGAVNSTVTHNTFTGNTGGIWIQSSRDCVVSENTVRDNTDWGILVESSNNVLVFQNELTQNTLRSIMLTSSSNNIVAENNVKYSDYYPSDIPKGIYLESSDDNYVRNNVMIGESDAAIVGVELKHSSNNRVELNRVSPGAPGINTWDDSNANMIVGNILDTTRGSYGICLSGSSNVLIRNDIKNFHTSFELSNGSNNTITENNVESRERLMNLFKFSNNTFYRNNFKGLTEIMDFGNVSTGLSSVNMWDNGSQGNYWNNYAGGDENGDGIGDIPYVIDANNQDRYPFKNLWI